MASDFLSGQRELGSGGKVIRGRRHLLPSFLPYSRPPSSAVLIPHQVPEAQTGRILSWVRGLISGVGKVFLSVLGSDGSSPSPSECFSNSDEYYDYSPNEHEDQLGSDDLTAFKRRESEAGRNDESLAISPKSETKLVIEQLLLQETFTRDECNKLVEIIQSRIPDINSVEIGEGTQNVVPIRASDYGQLSNHNRNLYRISNSSPRILSSFSPRFYADEASFPDIRKKAVMEAKKWFEEKKLSPSPTYDRSYGPCSLTNRMNQYGFEEDVDSPIEMAKSYMQSLPPWRSPSFSTKASPSCRNTTCNFGSHLLPSPEIKKRDYLVIGSCNKEENHRTYLKSLDDEHEFSKLSQSKLLSRLSVNEASTLVAKTCNEVEDTCLKLQVGNAAESGQPMETDNEISVGAILQPKEAFKESSEGSKFAELNDVEQVHYDIANMLPDKADMLVSDVSQVNCVKSVEMPLPAEEQIGSISAPRDSLVFSSVAERNNGDSFLETETLQLESITPAEPSMDKNSGDKVKFQIINSMQVDLDAAFNNAHPITDSGLPYENHQTQEEAIGSGENFETSSNFEEINNMKSELESTGDPTATSASNGGAPAASVSEGPPASDLSTGIRRTRANTMADKAHSTTDEPMLTGEPPEPSSGNKRKAKKIVKQKK